MRKKINYAISLNIGSIITILLSLIKYPVFPDWVAYGIPIPWYFRYDGPYLILRYSIIWPILIGDVIFWAFVIGRILLRYKPPFDETTDVFPEPDAI